MVKEAHQVILAGDLGGGGGGGKTPPPPPHDEGFGAGGYFLMSRTFVICKDATSSLPNLPKGVK